MRMVLIGAHQGKDIVRGGIRFQKGVAVLPDENNGPAKNLLMNFFDAYPEEMLEDVGDGKLGVRELPEVATLSTIPHSNHTIGANDAPPVAEAGEEGAAEVTNPDGSPKDPAKNPARPAGYVRPANAPPRAPRS